mmetsp:Transcript_4922/g.18276  ORF Transcript_4922/g.18276 Transcript_4922/m.18276 type:complete len:355 (-) Transcript_4922:545-1609(-)
MPDTSPSSPIPAASNSGETPVANAALAAAGPAAATAPNTRPAAATMAWPRLVTSVAFALAATALALVAPDSSSSPPQHPPPCVCSCGASSSFLVAASFSSPHFPPPQHPEVFAELGASAVAASPRHGSHSAIAARLPSGAPPSPPLQFAANKRVAHFAAPSASRSDPAGGRSSTCLSADHTAGTCGFMAALPNAAPHAAKLASASATTRGAFSESTLSNTCGTAYGAYVGLAHIASRNVLASSSCVTLIASPGGGRKDTGKYAATTSYSSSAAFLNASLCCCDGALSARAPADPQNAKGTCFHSSHTKSTFRGSFSPSQDAMSCSSCSCGDCEPRGGPFGDAEPGCEHSASNIS